MPVPCASTRVTLAGSTPLLLVGAADRERLAVDARREQAVAAAVARLADAAQHGVDAVAVAERVGETLEDDHAEALAEQRAVAAARERPHLAAAAQGAELGEDERDLGGQRRVHAAGEHHPAAAAAQLVDRRVHREQRRRAGGVEQVVRALEVEPVGDAPGHHVGHEPGRDVGVARRQLRLHQGADLVELTCLERGAHRGEQIHRLVEDERVLQDRRLAAMQVGAVAEDDAGVAMVVAAEVARVGEGVAGDAQGDELVGLAAVERVRHDPELARVEAEQVLQVAARCGLDAAGAQVALGVPRRLRLADRVDARDDVAPERGQVGRLREEAGHADDRDRLRARRALGALCVVSDGHRSGRKRAPPSFPPCRRAG